MMKPTYTTTARAFGRLPDVPQRCGILPISYQGNVNGIIGKFGGAGRLSTAVNQLQSLLYAA